MDRSMSLQIDRAVQLQRWPLGVGGTANNSVVRRRGDKRGSQLRAFDHFEMILLLLRWRVERHVERNHWRTRAELAHYGRLPVLRESADCRAGRDDFCRGSGRGKGHYN